MKQRADGKVVAGHAGPGVWVDGVMILPPSAGNDPTWLGNDVICNDEFSHLITCDEQGHNRTTLATDANGKVLGASRLAADLLNPQSRAWAAFLQDGLHGLFTSWGLSVPTGELYGMHDGAVFGRQNFQSEGGLCAWAVGDGDPSHLLWNEPSAVVVEFFALDRQQVLWTDNARRIHVRGGLSQPTQAQYCFQPSIVRRVDGSLFLMEWRDPIGLVLRPWLDADNGWIVHRGEAFGASAQVGDDVAVIVYSTNPSEQGPVQTARVSFNEPMVPLMAEPIPPQPEPEPPKPEPEPPKPEPEPPDPTPIPPQPEPQPPKERHVQISLDPPQKFEHPQNVTEVDHPDGQGLKALKTAEGKFKSITPDGRWDSDKDSAGAWERFQPQGGVYLHYDGESDTTYSVPCIEKPDPYQQTALKAAGTPQAAPTTAQQHGSPIMGGTQGPHEPHPGVTPSPYGEGPKPVHPKKGGRQ